MPRFHFPVDTRMRRRLKYQKEIRQLETKRDMLVDKGFLTRAKDIENQISVLRRQKEAVERS